MNSEIKTQWVEALLSGNYVQGKGALTTKLSDDSREHCCLGVLCDLAVKAGIVVEKDSERAVVVRYGSFSADDFNEALLPETVAEWAGIPDYNCGPNVSYNGERKQLSALNDSGHSFDKIADLIKEQL